MKVKELLKFKHFWLFFALNFRFYLIYYLFISAGLILLLGGLSLILFSVPQSIKDIMNELFWPLMNICGIILSTSAYYVYSKASTAFRLLTLPVSSVTRLFTIVIYVIPILLLITSGIYIITANIIGKVLTMMNFVSEYSFNPFRVENSQCAKTIWDHFHIYLLIQSISLMIGSFYPKLGFVKSMCIFILSLIFYFVFKSIFFPGNFDGNFIFNFVNLLISKNYSSNEILKQMPVISFVWSIVVIMVIPFCWYISFLRIKELEV